MLLITDQSLRLDEEKWQEDDGKQDDQHDLSGEEVPGPVAKIVEHGGNWGLGPDVHEVGVKEKIDRGDKNHVEIGPEDGLPQAFPGRAEAIDENGIEGAHHQTDVDHEIADINHIRKSKIEVWSQEGLEGAGHSNKVGDLKDEIGFSPEHEGHDQVEKIANMEGKDECFGNGVFIQNQPNAPTDPENGRDEGHQQSKLTLFVFTISLATDPFASNHPNYARADSGNKPEHMFWSKRGEFAHLCKIECIR